MSDFLYRMTAVSRRRVQGDSVFELQIPQLAVEPGQVVALVGESGCGKSTLLDLLALVLEPTAVESFLFYPPQADAAEDLAVLWAQGREDDLARLRRAHMGYVLQTGGLLPFLTVRQNILLPGQIAGEAVAGLGALASRLGIAECLDRPPSALSVGQRQRVAIARAIAHRPALVLADEPTAAVDRARARQVMSDLARLARETGTAVVVVTHDWPLIEPLADRVYGFEVNAVDERTTRSFCLPDLVGAGAA